MNNRIENPDEWEVDAMMAESAMEQFPAETPTEPQPVQWVSAYDHNRSYGGPEEGGWWFDTGTLLASIPCHNDEQVESAKKVLRDAFGPQFEGNHEIGSVLCEGVLQILVEDEQGADYPAERPHYE